MLRKALKLIEELTSDPEPEIPDVQDASEDDREVAELRSRLNMFERINREYFAVIEQMEKERDQWKEMFFTQSGEHQNAQAMLQKMLLDCSGNLRAALNQLNFFRKAAELEPVKEPKMLASIPTDVPEQYGKRIKELADSAMPQTDGKARRAEIAATMDSTDSSSG